MNSKEEIKKLNSSSISSSAAAASEGAIRRRRAPQDAAAKADAAAEEAAARAPSSSSKRRLSAVAPEEQLSSSSSSNSSTGIEEKAAAPDTVGAAPGGSQNESSKEPPAADTSKASCKQEQQQQQQQQQQRVSRLLIEITPQIRSFIESHVPAKQRSSLVVKGAADLDVLQRWVKAANEKAGKNGPKVNMAELVEDSHLVERIEPPPVPLESLSFKERLRLMADERRHQAAIKSLWGEKKDAEDCFADLNRSLAMGVNALIGIFLTFLGGYWAALYSGVRAFETVGPRRGALLLINFLQQLSVTPAAPQQQQQQQQQQECECVLQRIIVGLVCSLVCLVVEVLLFILHDERQRKKARRGGVTLGRGCSGS
ncbi:hypothetical protein, conserved [Eimeria tenella]|uniref:Uncharacterized protein n=1 Tax=Eimeria tenella TaxID=5802 RepID=U6KQ96_EIMTE|nr:hypothetical protein, conserved [Eimeria tenella]CDJ37613.1 hypothetical protein, conserved [Eimeria tenella]|eukprot:XP_013228451.1 hypothetical protein, conserved [Eimeria tenella]